MLITTPKITKINWNHTIWEYCYFQVRKNLIKHWDTACVHYGRQTMPRRFTFCAFRFTCYLLMWSNEKGPKNTALSKHLQNPLETWQKETKSIHDLTHIYTTWHTYTRPDTHIHDLTHIYTTWHTYTPPDTHIHDLTHIYTTWHTYTRTLAVQTLLFTVTSFMGTNLTLIFIQLFYNNIYKKPVDTCLYPQ
jgi:hypothetical protein